MHKEEFLRYLSVDKKYSSHTISAYSRDIDDFVIFVVGESDHMDFLKVDRDVFRAWIAFMFESGLSNRSINRKLISLRSFYRYLLKEDYINDNPLKQITPLKANKKIYPSFSISEMDSLWGREIFTDDFQGVRDSLILELLYFTGIRLSELIELKIKDIDLMLSQIKVLGKGNKERIIPICENFKRVISKYISLREGFLNDSKSEMFFITDSKKKVYSTFVYKKVNLYLSQVSSKEKRSPHMLRHTFATHLLDNGADINEIKELLGHSSLASTQHYIHQSIKKIKHSYNSAHPRAKKNR
ncbi:tyrosine-type recombinase/integrase [Ichthyobacterium seriolicida]|uniref:Integrase n=1 Tax=Ichthyobacterium seriolicida TaxID=242600 RepID=A0A1J1DZK1_9FLAO|nr:tyrosine-type recombinase/integrase [Ichthyobacterium seriolicida]BAV95321.1 integrase [Ichthyobacterium seriolicida]